MTSRPFLVLVFVLCCVHLSAQDIESKLAGSTGGNGFTVKNTDDTSLFTVRGDGKVGIGTTAPTANLHVAGLNGFLVTGTYGSGAIPDTGPGTRMMFYPNKAAFRVGMVRGAEWDDSNIGFSSTAMGEQTKASGAYSTAIGFSTIASGNNSTAMGLGATASGSESTAMGENTTASGYQSTAMGRFSKASGNNSTAMGENTTASGGSSTAMGWCTTASGYHSTAMGIYTTAISYASTALGQYNIGAGSTNTWIATDPIFEIGIGTSKDAHANALTVLKNGDIHWGSGSQLGTDQGGSIELGNSLVSSATPFLDFHYGIGSTQDYNYRIINSGDQTLRFATQSDTNVMVLTNGNIGIGIASPQYLLHVNGTAGKLGGGSWDNASDIRLKDIDGAYTRGLEDIIRLRPIRFHYKHGNARSLPSSNAEIGFVAQEVREVFPECVTQGADGYMDFNMHAVNVALVNAVTELHAQLVTTNTALETKSQEVQALRSEVNTLRSELHELGAVVIQRQSTSGSETVVK
jgi:hypothetical protein